MLKPGTKFLWSPELQKGFDLAKEEIVKAVENGVKHFETDRHTKTRNDCPKFSGARKVLLDSLKDILETVAEVPLLMHIEA